MADDDDDWDKEDSPQPQQKINQREQNGMAFFNRAPLNVEGSAAMAKTAGNARLVPEHLDRDQRSLKKVPTRDDDIDDFDDEDWNGNPKKGPNPVLR